MLGATFMGLLHAAVPIWGPTPIQVLDGSSAALPRIAILAHAVRGDNFEGVAMHCLPQGHSQHRVPKARSPRDSVAALVFISCAYLLMLAQ